MSKFYCIDCVISGHFVHSNSELFESFSEKEMRLFALQREITETKNVIKNRTETVWVKEKLKEEIELLKAKVKYIKRAVRRASLKKSKNLALLFKVSTSRVNDYSEFPNFPAEISSLKASRDLTTAESCVIKAKLVVIKSDIRLAQSRFIQSLQITIFPVEIFQVTTNNSSYTKLFLDNMTEAPDTVYTAEKWVPLDMPSSHQYKPVSSAISIVEGDQAPLSLVCQFTNIVASVLGCHLPARISILELGEVGTTRGSLVSKVGKLNMNVVTMCMVLGVGHSNIRPEQVLHNLRQMINRFREGVGDYILASECDHWEDTIDNICANIEDIHTVDSDDDWERVVTEYLPVNPDQFWESLDKPSDEAWEGLSIPSGNNLKAHRRIKQPDRLSSGQSSLSSLSSSVSSLLWGDLE